MKIWWEDRYIVTGDALSDALAGPIGLPSTQLVQVSQYLRAGQVQAFARGNRQHAVTVPVQRLCNSSDDALQQAATALQDHAASGTLIIYLDSGYTLTCAGACLQSCNPERTGAWLVLRFEFVVPGWVAGGLPAIETETMVMNGTINLTSGQDSVTATGLEMARTPSRAMLQIEKPASDAPNIWATLRTGTLTADGFTADLSAPPDRAGYKLAWFAL